MRTRRDDLNDALVTIARDPNLQAVFREQVSRALGPLDDGHSRAVDVFLVPQIGQV